MAGVEIEGLRDFRRSLKAAGAEFPKELRKSMKQVADLARGKARGNARSMGGVQARAAMAIGSRANPGGAQLAVNAKGRYKMANVAFFGALGRTGWNADRASSPFAKRQHPLWVGASWEAGRRGEGPYAINDAVADVTPEAGRIVMETIDRLYKQAFPE